MLSRAMTARSRSCRAPTHIGDGRTEGWRSLSCFAGHCQCGSGRFNVGRARWVNVGRVAGRSGRSGRSANVGRVALRSLREDEVDRSVGAFDVAQEAIIAGSASSMMGEVVGQMS
jgi:hypothetical protein